MPMTLFAVGFLLVVGVGLIAADVAYTHRRRRKTANNITTRYTTARNITDTYTAAGRPRPPHTDCGFGPNCALNQRETARQAAQDRLR